jgi:hypothetical protein
MSSGHNKDRLDYDQQLFLILQDLANAPSTIPIQASILKEGMDNEDLEILGLTFSLMHNPDILDRITPPLTIHDFQRLHIIYLPKCICSNIDSEWTDSPYIAAHSIAAWLKHLWDMRPEYNNLIDEWKKTLAHLVLTGEKRVRECVICGILEHLLSNNKIRKYFSDWQKKDILKDAYLDAVNIGFKGR